MTLDARTAGHALAEIASLLELQGEDVDVIAPYFRASRALAAADGGALEAAGRLRDLPPGVRDAIAELVHEGGSTLLDRLRESTPEGVFEMLRVPGLGTSRIRRIHGGLGIDTLQELEAAARDGRLASLPRFGQRVAEQVLRGIAQLREAGTPVLGPHGRAEGERLLARVRAHPGVVRAELAGDVRREAEVVHDLAVVAACSGDPVAIAAQLARTPGVRDSVGSGTTQVSIRYDDGIRLRLTCVSPEAFVVAWWHETGSDAHVREVVARAARRGVVLGRTAAHDAAGAPLTLEDEPALYAAAGLPWLPPELRDEAAAPPGDVLTRLLRLDDIAGVLHCHSQYSDGGATIAELAAEARGRGWRYVGISDHSQSAFYAGGLTRDTLLRQHDEIDAVNAADPAFRVLKGVEADILPCGRVDYPAEVLDRFDYVVASVHSRYGMDRARMTERICKALDDPHVTILGHPTGRLLLTREPYAVDVDAVLAKAGEVGAAVELNADPHRLDLPWPSLRRAPGHGAQVAIGPDAHSVDGLDNIRLGVTMARKGWLRPADVLNTRPVDAFLSFARARRAALR